MTDFAYSHLRSPNARRLMRSLAARVSDGAARWSSQSAISAFGRVLRDLSARRALELELARGEQMACLGTIGELLPRRIGAAQIALRPLEHADVTDLREFIDVAADVAAASISAAATVDDLVDAVGDALDGLHSFLVAHDLVPSDYLDDFAHLGLEAAVGRQSDDEAWAHMAHEARQATEAGDATAPAAENNLALAA